MHHHLQQSDDPQTQKLQTTGHCLHEHEDRDRQHCEAGRRGVEEWFAPDRICQPVQGADDDDHRQKQGGEHQFALDLGMAQRFGKVGRHIGQGHVLTDIEQDDEGHKHDDLPLELGEQLTEWLTILLLLCGRLGKGLWFIEFHPQPQGNASQCKCAEERPAPPTGIHSVRAHRD
nr:hypothetical protein [Brevibacterium aurantiacum]